MSLINESAITEKQYLSFRTRFDIVLNCGGREVLRVSRDSFITAQRSVDTVANTYIDTEAISLIPLDTKVESTVADLRGAHGASPTAQNILNFMQFWGRGI